MARAFDAGSSQLLSYTGTVVTNDPVTFSAWFRTDTLDQAGALIAVSDNTGNTEWVYLGVTALEQLIMRWAPGSPATVQGNTSGTPWSTGVWNHACFVVNAADNRLYLNGGDKATDSSNSASTLTPNRVSISALERLTTIQIFTGDIAEATIWNAALTDAEVATLAAGVSSLSVRPQSLVFYVPLVRDDDEDVVGGRSLTPVNSPTIEDHPPVYKIPGLQMIDYPEPTGPTLAVLNPHEGAPV